MKRISYFSYKGGSGRSSMLYNTLPFIAKKLNASPEHPLLVLDMDIDSAGLTFLFGSSNLAPEVAEQVEDAKLFTQSLFKKELPGEHLYKEDIPDIRSHPLFKQFIGVGKIYGMEPESILFLPADTHMESGTLEFREYGPLSKAIEKSEEYECAGIIFDCPSGGQCTATASIEYSDILVIVMRITYQFRKGTFRYLDIFDKQKSVDKELVIVPNAVPGDRILIGGQPFDYDDVKEDIIYNLKENVVRRKVNFHMLEDGRFGVPEVPRFKIREGILYNIENRTPEEEFALKMYEEVAEAVCGE